MTESDNVDYRDEDEFMKALRAQLDTSFREFDKLILSVSSGVLAFSVAFFNQSGTAHRHVTILMVSWGAFLLAIVSVAVSLWVEQAHKLYLIETDARSDTRERFLFRTIGWLNKTSGGTFLLGVVTLVLYLWFDVKGVR
jgi:hypothetical protein